ncbi:MAG: TIM barrel protein [Bacteroidetes bacterium]|nr:TIM barrel protein [Bacteroidota bacterium]
MMMKSSRRKFLKTAAAVSALAFLDGKKAFSMDERQYMKNFGLQLYTLRDIFGNDPKGYIQQISSYGYTQIESYEGKEGMFWGMTPAIFNQCIQDAGMTLVSSHCDISKDFEQKVISAASIGMKYLICAWVGPQKSIDDFKRIADDFNSKGALCKKHGIKFAYHNHDYSFKKIDGEIPQDIMMQMTDPELVDFEMDIYWVITGGADPYEYLKKYKGRFKLGHLKDRLKDALPQETDASCTMGTGSIHFKKILPYAKSKGMEYFFIEQERYDYTTPIISVKESAEYLKSIKI